MTTRLAFIVLCLASTTLSQAASANDVSNAVQMSDQAHLHVERQKRDVVDEIIDGLINRFSQTVDKALGLDDGDFKQLLTGLTKVGKAVAGKVFGFFQDFTSKEQDLDAPSANRIDMMMQTLEKDVQGDEKATTDSGEDLVLECLMYMLEC